ncbi:MAG: LrgB family protein [Janthinobacterium lividum]
MGDAHVTLAALWTHLSASPLLGLPLTLLAYAIGFGIYKRCNFSPWANPVALAIAILVVVLLLTHWSYERYFAGAQFIHFLLGPATVALAVPLAAQLPRLRRAFWPLLSALLAGSVMGIASGVACVAWLGGARVIALSMAPKSVTTPIAMGVTQRLGGLPSLTAVLVIASGIVGAVTAAAWFKLLRVPSADAQGLAMGVASGGIGVARAFQLNAEMGAIAGLGMGLNGVLTALLSPWLVPMLMRVFY